MQDRRRTSDALRAVDGLVHTHLQQAPVDARALANLAVAMLTEYSGARHGTLLLSGGGGLMPVFALGPGLEAVPAAEAAHDRELLDEVEAKGRLIRRDDRLAVPISIGGQVKGALYIEAGDTPFDTEVEALADGVATRIATLLHSASLLEDRTRRTEAVETLEALGAMLSAHVLKDDHLEHAVDAVLRTTGSQEAVLALLAERAGSLRLQVRGANPVELRLLAKRVTDKLLEGEPDGAVRLLGPAAMMEPLGDALLPMEGGAAATGRPLGFLAVRRRDGRHYGSSDRSVFRAMAHMLAGALARHTYFRKASEDTLTGTASRLALELAIVEALASAKRSGLPLSLLLIDVDKFKTINDVHGHLTGDSVLREVAHTMRSRLRARDFMARFGGDEFLVLLPETSTEEASSVAEELRRLVADMRLTPSNLRVSLSIGISAFPLHGATPKELVGRADEALYKSKAAGRNRVSTAEA